MLPIFIVFRECSGKLFLLTQLFFKQNYYNGYLQKMSNFVQKFTISVFVQVVVFSSFLYVFKSTLYNVNFSEILDNDYIIVYSNNTKLISINLIQNYYTLEM